MSTLSLIGVTLGLIVRFIDLLFPKKIPRWIGAALYVIALILLIAGVIVRRRQV